MHYRKILDLYAQKVKFVLFCDINKFGSLMTDQIEVNLKRFVYALELVWDGH